METGATTHESVRAMSHRAAAIFHVVVTRALLGGIKALISIVADLPEEFPAAIAIVPHRLSDARLHCPGSGGIADFPIFSSIRSHFRLPLVGRIHQEIAREASGEL
jgi:hypothetical protein